MSNIAKKKAKRKAFTKNKNVLHNNIPLSQSRGVSAEKVTVTRVKRKRS